MERPPDPAPAPDELQAGALWANNIARIAALAVDQKAAQGDAKDAQKKKAAKEAERAKGQEKAKATKPEDVKAETVVEELLKAWSPPLLQFAITLLHLAFYFAAPFQLKFMMPYVMAYLLPAHCTLVSMYSRKDRELWMSYWSVVAVVEYLEMTVFGIRYRILVWWPMIKLVGAVALFSVVKKDAKGKPGAVAVVTPFLPAAK